VPTTSLKGLLRRLFPEAEADGTPRYLAFPHRGQGPVQPYGTPPALPADVFAAAGHLLELSGAYHHVVPEVAERPARQARQVVVSAGDVASARAAAGAWRAFDPDRHYDPEDAAKFAAWLGGEGAPLRVLFEWWEAVFLTHGEAPVYAVLDPAAEPPEWWKPAIMLLVAADEAFAGYGYQVASPEGNGSSDAAAQPAGAWISVMSQYRMAAALGERPPGGGPAEGGTLAEGIASISSAALDIVAVVPKARTAAVGCTMRSLSHHLALLPPRGVAKASWIPFLSDRLPSDSRQMNLLLVPFPFSIPADAFRAKSHFTGRGVRWGFFEIEQTWLQNVTAATLLDFVKALAEEAEKECGHIHGVVFPEMALNQAIFTELSRALPGILPQIEIFVAGQSGVTGPGKRPGNFVSIAVYHGRESDDARIFITRREKHHRWKIDRGQVLDYGLEGILSPSMSWWEDIDLLTRRIDFAVVREGSVFTALICEDLARIDPCQELLRAVGPSVVFALLMDAPQLRFRWPGRYATVLAEDPGTAMLTFTSRALMTRQHRLGKHKSTGDPDRVVALWRDDGGDPQEIACPTWAHGVRLTLSGKSVVDATLDGRDDWDAVSWRYAGHSALKVAQVGARFADVLGPDDLALQEGR